MLHDFIRMSTLSNRRRKTISLAARTRNSALQTLSSGENLKKTISVFSERNLETNIYNKLTVKELKPDSGKEPVILGFNF